MSEIKISILIIGTILYFPLSALCHVLHEFPHIWKDKNRFKFMQTKWWMDSSPRENRTWWNVIFADAYHFFNNFPDMYLVVLLSATLSWWLLLLWIQKGILHFLFELIFIDKSKEKLK